MNWYSIQQSWNELRGRFAARWGERSDEECGTVRNRRRDYFCKRCGISGNEANRKMHDWIKDPGVLDDWNDTRSILDM